MGTSATERQRRSRAHKRGDHSLCSPGRCDGHYVTPVTRHAPSETVTFGARGQRLWGELTKVPPEPAARVLIEEACRIADRLDRLDGILTGSDAEWMRFKVDDDGEVTVYIGAPLAEARQQATALKAILAELRQAAGRGAAKPAGEGSVIDQLAAVRARRRADAAGS
jgi:hypothetical protein